MGTAGIRRIAERAHRGQLYAGGGLFIDHLERVARMVAELGGSTTEVHAAWLHSTPDTGIDTHELLALGVPITVANIVATLQPRGEYPAVYAARIIRNRSAALVRYAILTDWHRYLAGQHTYGYVRDQHLFLADRLGLPCPALAAERPTPQADDPAADWRPDGDEHWDTAARRFEQTRGPRALPTLLAAYRGETDPTVRRCCLGAIRGAIYAIAGTATDIPRDQLLELSERWWTSADGWEENVAVLAARAINAPVDRAAMLDKVDSPHEWVAASAIDALTGPGDRIEIEALRRILERPYPSWRWAKRSAVKRLIRIGGPDAARVLDQRPPTPVDPPWRDDPGWLHRHATEVIPVLVDNLGDGVWQYEATYALGELRAAPAVGPLCAALERVGHGVWHIEALGKIGSAEAVPALLDQVRHGRSDVRDHALRALARIGGPQVVDAAIAACDDPHPVVRDRAARILARHGDERAVPQLIRLCDGPHAAIAAEALARCADPRALPTLWHLFGTAPDRRTRHAAGRAIARTDGPREVLYQGDVRVWRAFIWLLGHKPAWESKQLLTSAAAHQDPIVRARAAESMARLDDPGHTSIVQSLLDDPDRRVRAAAATALRRLAR